MGQRRISKFAGRIPVAISTFDPDQHAELVGDDVQLLTIVNNQPFPPGRDRAGRGQPGRTNRRLFPPRQTTRCNASRIGCHPVLFERNPQRVDGFCAVEG